MACELGDCSVREAVIFSSLIKKVSLNVLHAAAALLRLADMDYNGRIALCGLLDHIPVSSMLWFFEYFHFPPVCIFFEI